MTTKINQTKEIKIIEGTDYTKIDTNLVSMGGIVYNSTNNENNIIIEQQYIPQGYNIVDAGDYLSVNFYVGETGTFCRVGDFKTIKEPHLKHIGMAWAIPDDEDKTDNVLQIRIYKDKKIAILVKSINGRFFVMDKDRKSEEVFSNEEIKAKALILTKKLFISNAYYLINDARISDLRKKIIYNLRRGEEDDVYKFSEETQRIVEKFLGFDSPGNKETKEIWLKEVKPEGICTLPLMYRYIYENLKKKKEIKKSKEEIFKDLIEETGVGDIFETPKKYEGKIFWDRIDNEIISFYVDTPIWKDEKYLFFFSYDTKTKKKKYGEYSYKLKDWSFPICSSKYIGNNFNITNKEIIIINNSSVKELFAGTNCEWVLNYAPNYFYKHTDLEEREDGFLSELITEKKMSQICLGILISTAEPILELLLQAKLFNLYFIGLKQKLGSYHRPLTFEEVDSDMDLNDITTAGFPYYKKETNLKKMTRICISNLRILDSKLDCKRLVDYHNGNRWERDHIDFGLFKRFFNKDLLTADSQLFEKSLDRWIEWKKENNSIWFLGEVADLLKDKMGFNEKLDYISNYRNTAGSLLRDYLVSRSKLEKLSKSKPELINIFSKKEYPLAPKKAIKFFRYIPEEHGSADNFMRQYSNNYREACERGDFEFNFPKQATKREGSDLLGCTVVLTPREHLSFLHDKATYWVSFYQDVGKEEEFAKAVERVKPLEWEDKESGLCIVAPKKVTDIRREGEVLSHCVATYIDPIINGTENIMLLRRMDMPNHPFFTVDISNVGDIRQVHCYRNLCLTAEDQQRAYDYSEYEVYNKTFDIVGFLLKWAKAMKGKIKAKSIHEQYGALLAQR